MRAVAVKKILPVLVFLVAALVGVGIFRLSQTGQPTPRDEPAPPVIDESEVAARIHMRNNAYEPDNVTIRQGQAVRFINDGTHPYWPASNIHPTHELYSEFDPKKALQPGESWAFRFDRTGSWRMHDHLYPFIKGMITVE